MSIWISSLIFTLSTSCQCLCAQNAWVPTVDFSRALEHTWVSNRISKFKLWKHSIILIITCAYKITVGKYSVVIFIFFLSTANTPLTPFYHFKLLMHIFNSKFIFLWNIFWTKCSVWVCRHSKIFHWGFYILRLNGIPHLIVNLNN